MSLFRKRDIGVLLLVIVSIYLTWYDSSNLNYSIDPAWFIDQRFEESDSHNSRMNYRQVPPIVTDLEGDGAQEVIIITSEFQLKVFNAESPDGDSDDIYHPEEVSSAALFAGSSQRGRMPVRLATGYTAPYSPIHARSQVIVVVLDDWTVICYDSSLVKLWEKAVAHSAFDIDRMSEFFKIKDVAIHIAPLQLREDIGPGVVIVGANMALRKHAELMLENDENHPMVHFGHGIGAHHKQQAQTDFLSQLEHFSIFALDSSDGHVLWKHDGLEVRAEQYSRSLPQHAYSLDVKDLMTQTHHAAGINDWTVFRQSLVDELPHTWFRSDHTTLRIAHFVRRHIGAHADPQHPHKSGTKSKKWKHKDIHKGKGRNGKPATLLNSLPLLNGEVSRPALSEQAALPHNAAEHTENPNVIVAHTNHGLEVIALRTGTPITSLALAADKVYADLDGDSVVDMISVLDTPEKAHHHQTEFSTHQYVHTGSNLQHCMVIVMSGLPAQSQLFNGSVCPQRPSLKDPLGYAAPAKKSGEESFKTKVAPSLGTDEEHPMIIHAPPLILHKVDPDTMQESQERDLIVAIHSGVVTSYSGSGKFNWQVRGAPKWTVERNDHDENKKQKLSHDELRSSSAAAVLGFDADAERALDLGSHNSIYSNILVSGDTMLALLSRDGDILATAEIPRTPEAQPVIGDFDNDGVTDVIIVTQNAILGYHVHVTKAPHTVLIALTILIVIAVIVFVSNIQAVPITPITADSLLSGAQGSFTPHPHNESQRPAPNTSHLHRKPSQSKGSSIFQIIRSTDEHHLD